VSCHGSPQPCSCSALAITSTASGIGRLPLGYDGQIIGVIADARDRIASALADGVGETGEAGEGGVNLGELPLARATQFLDFQHTQAKAFCVCLRIGGSHPRAEIGKRV
jgi:hypothetical protein